VARIVGLHVWVGFDDERFHGGARLARALENFYRIPFERFERFSPWGSVVEVADALARYRDAGCRLFNVMPVAATDAAGIDAMAKIAERLRA
jgi:hypothetical protein